MTLRHTERARTGSPFGFRFLAPLYLGAALNPINSSVIATALVPIAQGIGVPVGRTALLVSVLYLAAAIAFPAWGKLAEVFGPRRIFGIGTLLVLVGGLVGVLGRDLAALVVARALIGVGTASGYPTAMLLIRRRAGEAGLVEPPGSVLGGLSIAGMATAALGLPLGGLLLGWLGWRAAFGVNVPFALLALIMVAVWVPADPAPPDRAHRADRADRDLIGSLDVAGMIAFAGFLGALLVFLLDVTDPRWWLLAVSAAFGVALVVRELRARHPFFDFRLLAHNPALTRSYLRVAVTTLCIYAVLYGVTQWLQAARAMTSEQTGLLLLPMSLTAALLTQPVASRNLVRLPLYVAALTCLVGSAGLLLLTSATPIGWLVPITVIFGVTLATTLTGNQVMVYASVAADQLGTASGLFRTFSYLGSIASSAVISVVFASRVGDGGLHLAAVIMVGVSLLGLLLLVLDRTVGRVASERRTDG